MSVAEAPFEIFGEKSSFALEIRSLPTAAVSGAEPEDWRGSWGEWRLWFANLNLCELRLDTQSGVVEVREIRWFLAPLLNGQTKTEAIGHFWLGSGLWLIDGFQKKGSGPKTAPDAPAGTDAVFVVDEVGLVGLEHSDRLSVTETAVEVAYDSVGPLVLLSIKFSGPSSRTHGQFFLSDCYTAARY